MITEGIKKLNDEIYKNKSNPHIEVIGKYLIEYLNRNPDAAKEIMNKDKTIGKSLQEMKKVAEKKRVGNCAILTDQEGFEIVLKYFEIKNSKGKSDITPEAKPIYVPAENVEVKKDIDFDVNLEDFL
ncbi:hypothetical protein [Clostridium thailandense]|uniref:hypothetical protein n=1 Tax=Clostridium thailandense TaxID=2794346 RepID=UPI003989B2EC